MNPEKVIEGKYVLIVDDEEDILESLVDLLEMCRVDIAPDFVTNIERLARQEGLDNVTGIVNSERDAMLPADSIDLVFLSDTYHHFEYPQSMLTSIRQALRDNGELVVIDFRKLPGRSSTCPA